MVKLASEATDHRRGIDHIGISASFVVHDGHGNVLLHKRGPKARDEQGTWDNGGGAIEFGETIEAAIRRELKEELCADAVAMEFLTVYDAHRVLQDGTPTHWIAVVYSVQVNPDQISIGEPEKIEALGWFTIKTLPSPLHSQFQKSFLAAKARGIIS